MSTIGGLQGETRVDVVLVGPASRAQEGDVERVLVPGEGVLRGRRGRRQSVRLVALQLLDRVGQLAIARGLAEEGRGRGDRDPVPVQVLQDAGRLARQRVASQAVGQRRGEVEGVTPGELRSLCSPGAAASRVVVSWHLGGPTSWSRSSRSGKAVALGRRRRPASSGPLRASRDPRRFARPSGVVSEGVDERRQGAVQVVPGRHPRRASAPHRGQSRRSAQARSRAAARWAASVDSASHPVRPSATSSGIPPAGVPTAGRPQAMRLHHGVRGPLGDRGHDEEVGVGDRGDHVVAVAADLDPVAVDAEVVDQAGDLGGVRAAADEPQPPVAARPGPARQRLQQPVLTLVFQAEAGEAEEPRGAVGPDRAGGRRRRRPAPGSRGSRRWCPSGRSAGGRPAASSRTRRLCRETQTTRAAPATIRSNRSRSASSAGK